MFFIVVSQVEERQGDDLEGTDIEGSTTYETLLIESKQNLALFY